MKNCKLCDKQFKPKEVGYNNFCSTKCKLNAPCKKCDSVEKNKDGRCKLCNRKRCRESYAKYRDRRIAYQKNYQKDNPDKIREYQKLYYSKPENKERRRKLQKNRYHNTNVVKNWRKNNREKIREINRKSARRMYKQNPEKARQKSYSWIRKNPDKARKSQYNWRKNNIDKARKTRQQWFEKNPHKRKEYRQKRRATLLTLPCENYNFKLICEFYGNVCLCCGKKKKLTVDHIIPISWDNCPGDIPSNIQPLCLSCNIGKRDYHDTDYRYDKGIKMLKYLENKKDS